MARPVCCRRISHQPGCVYLKPQGVPLDRLEEVVLALDELEALWLADLEGLYQEEAAARMGVSRPTFARIVESARHKVARAITAGHALRIDGGHVMMESKREFRCEACGHVWSELQGSGRPDVCPACQSPRLHRCHESREGCGCGGQGRGHGHGHRHGANHECCGRGHGHGHGKGRCRRGSATKAATSPASPTPAASAPAGDQKA